MSLEIFSINNTKIANCIRKESNLPATRNVVTISKRTAKSKIQNYFVISQDLSYFEMTVADAIYSVYLQGETKFTPRKILMMMTGDENISLPKERKKQLETIIEKLCLTTIDIFCPQETNDKVDERYEGAFLFAVKEKNEFRFTKDHPLPLYAYGEDRKQMITIPRFLLNVPGLSNTNENILLKQYLIHELELVRNKNNSVLEKTFRVLDYKNERLLSALEVDLNTFSSIGSRNKKIKEIYKKIRLIFEYWSSKEQTGYLIHPVEFHDEDFSIYVSPDMFCQDPMWLQN